MSRANEIIGVDDIKEEIRNSIEDAVVQVFSQVVPFNWREPYRSGEQHEQRGSGFFIDEHGYIITSAHVVDEATTVWIQLPPFGQKTFFVDVVGFCPEGDLALMLLHEEDRALIVETLGHIPWISLGDSDLVRRTDEITVLGYPLGQYRIKSLTGVVSGWETGIGRALIQITAPINPGNSGGPLIDEAGQAIGIAIAAVFPAQNVGYAIPINELKLVLADLVANPLVRRPSLGIAFTYANDALASYLKNPLPAGLYINRVLEHSLAADAGLLEGDMLYQLNGMTIDAYGDASVSWTTEKVSIHDIISRLSIGDQLRLTIYRNGEPKEMTIEVQLKPPYPIRATYPDYEEIDYEIIAGMVVMSLTENHIAELIQEAPYLLEYTKIERKVEPLLVISHILPGSVSQLIRSLQPGMIIAELNGIPVHTLAEFRQALLTSIKTGFLTIKTTANIMAALAFDTVLTDEQRLADLFGYELSETIVTMMQQRK